MIGAIRSELRKFFTTRLWWGMAIAILLAGGAFSALFAFFTTAEIPDGSGPTGDATQIANTVYTGGLSIGYLLLLTIGVLQIGSEYRHKTITSTFLSTPRRIQVMVAKVVALLVIGAIYGVISLLGSVSVGATILSIRDQDVFPSTEVLRTLALSLLVLGLWALIGLGIGILIPNQVAALLIGVGVAWIVEPIVGLVIRGTWSWGREHLVQYFPTEATNAVVNAVTQGGAEAAGRLEWWAGALVLVAYATVLAGLGIVRTVRRDVS